MVYKDNIKISPIIVPKQNEINKCYTIAKITF
jgi:hypothetical protein